MSVCVFREGGLKVPAGLSWDSLSRVNGTQRELCTETLNRLERSTGVISAGQNQEHVQCNRSQEPMEALKNV